ncbi:MAG: hypothetical protein M3Z29_14170 [Pseudomonadota bacterium]|nr:hypothetical protein [Pseudomonadota bacterium]
MKHAFRKSLTTAGLALLLAAGGAHADGSATGHDDDSDRNRGGHELEGTWIVTFTPPFGGATFLAVTSYIPGGVSILSPDRLPPVPGLGTTIGTAQGSWRAVGHRQFVSTHVEFRYGSVGEVLGTAKVRATTRLTSDDTFDGHGQLVFCDAMLDHCSAPGAALATVSGRRLRAEAPILP